MHLDLLSIPQSGGKNVKTFLCWSFVDVSLIFSCPADHVIDWQPRILMSKVEARSVDVKYTHTPP